MYTCIPYPNGRLERETWCTRPPCISPGRSQRLQTSRLRLVQRFGELALSPMQDMEAGPGPGSAASRADGRSNLQIRFVSTVSSGSAIYHKEMALILFICRTLLCERGLLQRADGSARWCQDKTCVLAAIYGPRTTLGRKENPEQAVVEVFFKPKSGVYRYNAPGMHFALPCTLLSCVQVCQSSSHDNMMFAMQLALGCVWSRVSPPN